MGMGHTAGFAVWEWWVQVWCQISQPAPTPHSSRVTCRSQPPIPMLIQVCHALPFAHFNSKLLTFSLAPAISHPLPPPCHLKPTSHAPSPTPCHLAHAVLPALSCACPCLHLHLPHTLPTPCTVSLMPSCACPCTHPLSPHAISPVLSHTCHFAHTPTLALTVPLALSPSCHPTCAHAYHTPHAVLHMCHHPCATSRTHKTINY